MEAEIRGNFDAEVELIPSSGGVFEVSVDGTQVFSKNKLRRFPEAQEVVQLIREKEA